MKQTYTLILITLGLCLLSCNIMSIEKKYDWISGACSPKNYPIDVYKGAFVFEDDSFTPIFGEGQTDVGWGSTGPTYSVGPDLKPLPVSLELYWISYAEGKFYKGIWQLPQEKMAALFEQGYTDLFTLKRETYHWIIAGMAPGGVVVVWVGGGSSTVEIARFQAEEAEWPPMKKLVPGNPTLSREGYLKIWDKEAAAYLKEHGVPYGLWDTYRTRYPWHP
ncbi:MAG: DUF2931 family protein, partial [Bacteroidales bacterium]